jgi:dephospho-CoA kinase
MLKVGLTGGIGSGKSLVCEIFKRLHVPVYEADRRAKLLMNEDASLRESLIRLFGESIYSEEGLNRGLMAGRIFQEPDMLVKVNRLVHPYVFRDFGIWQRKYKSASYVIHEAAIIFESGGAVFFDKIITVEAPEELRIQRVMKRDRVSREQVMARLQNQWPGEKRVAHSDYVIMNDLDKMVLPQVLKIHKQLTGKQAGKR